MNGHLTHVMIALGALVFAMTAATRMGVTVPITAAFGQTAPVSVTPPAPAHDVLPAGVVVDDGVPF
jgi:hypothetical protein